MFNVLRRIGANSYAVGKEINKIGNNFIRSERQHVVICNPQGYASSNPPKSGPDSGGQLEYINRMASSLGQIGFLKNSPDSAMYKVTILARAFRPDDKYLAYEYGYGKNSPADIPTLERRGIEIGFQNPFVRYVYVEDGGPDQFVRKEDIYPHLGGFARGALEILRGEATLSGRQIGEYVDWLSSHYIDGALVGQMIARETGRPHAFTPHSLGHLKNANLMGKSPQERATDAFKREYEGLRLPLRMLLEAQAVGAVVDPAAIQRAMFDSFGVSADMFIGLPAVDALVPTSSEIQQVMSVIGADQNIPQFFFPPGVDTDHFYPRKQLGGEDSSPLYCHLARVMPFEIFNDMWCNPHKYIVMVEAGRMDKTKQKVKLVRAMKSLPENTILLITGKKDNNGVYEEIENEIRRLGLGKRVFLIGLVPDDAMGPLMGLPHGEIEGQFKMAIAPSASYMEGFGMFVLNALAGGLVTVSSELVPVAMMAKKGMNGATIVQMGGDGEEERFADAINHVIRNIDASREMAMRGHAFAQDFTWDALTRNFLREWEPIVHRYQ